MSTDNFFHQIQPKILTAGNYAALLLILTTPFSTALTTVATVLLVVFWLLSAQFKHLPALYRKQPVPFMAFLLFVYFLFGISYSSASFGEAFRIVGKYRELILITFLIPFVAEEPFRKRALSAFVTASVITLISSYILFFCFHFDLVSYTPEDSPSIKSRITHSLFISFFAFYCAHRATEKNVYFKYWIVLFLASVHNLFFIVPGRTGQLIFLLLLVLFSLQRFSKKGVFLSILAGAVFLALFLSFSDKAERILDGFSNTYQYFQSDLDDTSTSMGKRLTFWKYTSYLIAEKPWFGFGTGSYAMEYERIAPRTDFMPGNPHNEFLMITAQLGTGGLFLFLGLLASMLLHSLKLTGEPRWIAQGVLLVLVINSLFNSTFLDHTEGHWFACLIALFFYLPFSENKRSKPVP